MTSEVRILHRPLVPENSGTTETFSAARFAHIAQSVEHTLGKGEVTGSNPVVGSVAEKVLCMKRRAIDGEAEI